ncbi:MAG: DegT/DnrJ/EryC1/StrS family aminotransferase [Candidatus Aminicenantia bacterium]
MYFVHPQIKLSRKNLKRIFFSFFKSPNLYRLEKELSLMLPGKQLVFTDMGRSAFKIILEKLNLRDSQIIFPAYICDIFYSIFKRYNIQPVFLDIDINTFNIKPESILAKITPETKAILVSHTYGLPVNVKKIRKILSSNNSNTIIIEDCAHAFGAKFKDNFRGNTGPVAFFSLYKQFPTFRGGLLVCPEDWEINLPKTNFSFRDFISFLNSFSLLAFLFKTFGQNIAPRMIRKEKTSEPSGLNSLSLNFFSNFLKKHTLSFGERISLALFFQKELEELGFLVQQSENNVFCYLSALVPKKLEKKRDKLVKELMKERVFCTRIWHTPIILNSEAKKEYNINLNNFPNTIEAAKRIINFPLHQY